MPCDDSRPRDAAHAAHDAARAASSAALARHGTAILRAVILLNGAAAAATLAFMTQVIGPAPALARSLVLPLALFGFGLTVATFSIGFGYFVEVHRGRALALQERAATPPHIRDTPASQAALARAWLFEAAGFGAVFVAMAATITGFGLAAWALIAGTG